MIRTIKETEIAGLNRLTPPDWNYDYEVFLNDFLPHDYFHAFVLILENRIVGTGNVFVKGKIGWLANIIVEKDFRGKGLGFEMTKFLVDFLDRKGCETQLLIATELGEPVYRKIGFKKVTVYQSFDSEVDQDFNDTSSIRKLVYSDLNSVCNLDLQANAEDRAHLIEKHFETGMGYFNSDNELLGFYLPAFGRGLVISKDKQVGKVLLKLKHSEKGKRTLLPIDNQEGMEFLEHFGLKKGFQFSRMILGKTNNWNPEYIFSYGSGYCG
ncbi:MAG: GNAT family N-acetyltransferase [Saprospiraceae bacterium]|nr:GNAT family N-acetyltransferase [Saprospiraceae bacterium]